jgi:hypothetical protein
MNLTSYLLPVSDALAEEDKRPIFFQFFPNITGDSKEAQYETPGGMPLGRAESFQVYKGSSNKTLSISAQFAATGESVKNYTPGIADPRWVQRQVKRLQALTEPIYDRQSIFDKTTFNAPPLILLTHGLKYVNVPVVIKSVGVESASGTIIDLDGLPQVVDVTIQVTTNYPYGYVPGYLNTLNLFDAEGKVNVNEHNYSGSSGNLDGSETIMDDQVRTTSGNTGGVTNTTDETNTTEVLLGEQ